MDSAVDGRRQRSIATRAAILDAAELLFSGGGFEATSLRAIANAVGMSHAGVLKHFRTKGELLAEVLVRLEAGNSSFALSIPSDLPAAERVRLLAAHTMAQRAAVNLRVILLGEATQRDHPAHAFVVKQLDAVEGEVGAALGVDGVDLLALWNGMQVLWLYLHDVDPVSIADAHFAHPGRTESPRAASVTARPRSATAAAPDSRELEITAAAAAAFSQEGFRATSLRSIAADLGVSHGTVLYHFPSKIDLLTSVLAERDLNDALPWEWDSTPLDFLNGMYLQAVHNESNPGLNRLFSTLVSEAVDASHPAHDFFRRRYETFRTQVRAALTSLVTSGLAHPDIDPDAEAVAFIALWEGLGLRSFYREDPIGLPERLRAHLNRLLTVRLDHA